MEADKEDSRLGKRATEGPSTTQELKELLGGALEYITELLNIEDVVEQMKAFIYAHPFVSCFLAISLSTCLIPVVIFLVFAVTTLLVSLMILLMIEGTIIACAGVVLLFVLGGCLTFSFGLSVSMAFTYKILTGLLRMLPPTQPQDESTGNHPRPDGFKNPKALLNTETLRSGVRNED